MPEDQKVDQWRVRNVRPTLFESVVEDAIDHCKVFRRKRTLWSDQGAVRGLRPKRMIRISLVIGGPVEKRNDE